MYVIISPGDINSYTVNKEGKYWTQVLQIFLTIKHCSRRHATAYSSCCSTDLQDHSRWM